MSAIRPTSKKIKKRERGYSLALKAPFPRGFPRGILIMKSISIPTSKCWLATSPHRELNIAESNHLEIIKSSAFDWCFAREGDGDELHFHFAVRFPIESVNVFSTLSGWNIQIVPEHRWDLCLDYCKKSGFYEHLREKLPEVYSNPEPVWRPWQQKVLDMMNDSRKVICVCDERGGTGKTFLAMWHAVRYRAVIIPMLHTYQDLMRAVYANPSELYFIDLPRALTKRQQKDIFAAAETIKNGFAFDERYSYRKRYFNPPKVVIYTNQMPDISQLSVDRWVFIYPEHT